MEGAPENLVEAPCESQAELRPPLLLAPLWFSPAAVGAIVLAVTGRPTLVVLGGGLLLGAICAGAWALLASRPSDYETIGAIARAQKVQAVRVWRVWAPFNGQWMRPRQYRIAARDRSKRFRVLEVAFPLIGPGPVWVRLSLDHAMDPPS